ncbi:MAG: FAD-binding oxidoreductase [Methylobacter sp.]|uniref:FAD-binding oxidoreductase n=1 Tax=Methylobacter sp. TaxID=2051955 RepID=UPI0025DC05E7|nr:FAD-binding oxidoreductase [Methylobacter sp.]MCK9621552.1 FAD-binding oxidoreductase [Methylobacter sp.]
MPNNEREPHRWGFRDTRFTLNEDGSVTLTGNRYSICGYAMPYFIPFVESVLNVCLSTEQQAERQEVQLPASNRNEAFCEALNLRFPPEHISFADAVRLPHSHGQTTVDEVYQVLYGKLPKLVDAVFYCTDTAEAQALVELAAVHDVCLLPYGGGTSVSNALRIPADEQRMVVAVDTSRMNRIVSLERNNMRVTVQAGICGADLERQLRAEGYTLGHEPDSIEFSTVGGWIATNASGMKKNRYGNIEDVVEAMTVVTPLGTLQESARAPRVSSGSRLHYLLFGSEGNFGLITEAVLKLRPLPEVTQYQSILFRDFPTGIAFLQELSKGTVWPASIRLVDNPQFRFAQSLKPAAKGWAGYKHRLQRWLLTSVKKFDPETLAAATIVIEGSADEVIAQRRALDRLVRRYGAIYGGAENGQRGYQLTYAIAYIRDLLMRYSVIGETYETSASWDCIQAICDEVKRAAELEHARYGFPGKPYISARITQIYPTGACIYFTHGVSIHGVENADQKFHAVEQAMRAVILDHGGSISHHHGIGKLRASFIPQLYSEATKKTLLALKRELDPRNVFGASNNLFDRSQ